MKRIYSYVVAVFLIGGVSLANAGHTVLVPLLDVDMEFKPNQEEIISNPLFWSVSIECKLSSSTPSAPATAKSLKNAASINGYQLNEGKSITMNLAMNKTMHIKADGSAKFSIINLGQDTIKAKCKI